MRQHYIIAHIDSLCFNTTSAKTPNVCDWIGKSCISTKFALFPIFKLSHLDNHLKDMNEVYNGRMKLDTGWISNPFQPVLECDHRDCSG